MVRIPDEWQNNPIFLYPSEHDAYEGTKTGGSGFLLGFDADRIPGMQTVYAVTNAHVIENGNCTARVNKLDGTFDVLELDEREWIMPSSGDDVAIFKIGRYLDRSIHSYVCVPNRMLATREKVEEFGIGPGDETVTIGRFINAEGVTKNTPTVRFGNIAQMPIEPIEQDRFVSGSTQRFRQLSYLVEAKSISGYSGSLVFAHLSPMSTRPEGKPHSWETFLLGVSWGYVMSWERVEGAGENARVRVNTGMMGVVPAWILSDLLMRPDVVEGRDLGQDQFIYWQELRAKLDAGEITLDQLLADGSDVGVGK